VTLENDRALLDAFRRGERPALTRVFDLYVEDIGRTLRAGVVVEVEGQRHRVGAHLPEGEIEVLIQETFTRAFQPRARESYDGLRPYGAWLATIARNLLVDRARQERKHAREVPVEDVGTLSDEGSAIDPSWRIEEEQLGAIVRRVTGELDELDREIFRLRVQEGASFRAAAEALKTTEIVIRRRDTRLRARLLEALRAEGFLENARVRIGTSLLGRRDKQHPEGDR
jgi:RNA polymerase sigma-70 factor (ECF subfamily)